jgi:hypothetical protein
MPCSTTIVRFALRQGPRAEVATEAEVKNGNLVKTHLLANSDTFAPCKRGYVRKRRIYQCLKSF